MKDAIAILFVMFVIVTSTITEAVVRLITGRPT